jgi:hypothetical protein
MPPTVAHRSWRAGALAVAVAGMLVLAGCAHAVSYDPYVTTIDVQQAGSEAADDAGLNLFYGYECEIDGEAQDQSRFSINCQTTTGDGLPTTLTGSGQADSNRHYHGTWVIKVEDRTVATLHCLGSVEAPRC